MTLTLSTGASTEQSCAGHGEGQGGYTLLPCHARTVLLIGRAFAACGSTNTSGVAVPRTPPTPP